MELKLIIFFALLSFTVAKLEIEIEGKDGWARNLPTWRIKNKLTDLILNNAPLTGYHLWMFSTIFVLLHFPFILGITWTFSWEIKLIAFFLAFITLEDFLWFVLNPAYGIRKFNKTTVTWHHIWIGPIPLFYLTNIFISISLFSIGSII